jgi:hypothetical protein
MTDKNYSSIKNLNMFFKNSNYTINNIEENEIIIEENNPN